MIRPVLELLGWADYLPQQGTTRNEDIPDYLLFTDAASKERAAGRTIPEERFRDAIVVEESKRFGLSLDARDRDAGRQSRTPHGQILRYLSTADIESESRIRWGFLTNGGLWRLYDYRARPRATGYFEADLGEMLTSGGEDGLRLFYLLFRRDSFTPQQGATTSFLEAALAQGRRYEEKVAQDLSSVVFERVFPKLVQALADSTGEDHRPIAERYAELLALDPAEAVLDLKVLDPAMGSGQFLVTTVDFLSDYIAELAEYVPAVPEWLDGEYSSPLVERVATIRRDILQRAQASDWVMDETQLTDQAIIRRMVLKRCIYGVDKNPLTVELAKVSLWLHSFTVGAPLSFLDHHLRCGDSLVGLRVPEAAAELNRLGGLFASSAIAGAEAATSGMQRIEEMSDADVAEVRESAELFRGVEDTTANLRGLLDFLCGLRWLTSDMRGKARTALETPLVETLGRRRARRTASWRGALTPLGTERPAAMTHPGQGSKSCGAMPGTSRTVKASCIGRRPSPASGSGGRKNNRLAVSTPSSATRPGTASSSRRLSGSPLVRPA